MSRSQEDFIWNLAEREQQIDFFQTVRAADITPGLIIQGPAGVGKTRLAEEIYKIVTHGGDPGVQLIATGGAKSMPLGAISPLLPPGVDLSDAVEDVARTIAALRQRKTGKWFVFLDDLQNLDMASCLILSNLMSARAVFLVATIRGGVQLDDGVKSIVDFPDMARIDLVEFSKEQTERVLHSALGGLVAEGTLRVLHEKSGGNILYLREIISGALKAGFLHLVDGLWVMQDPHRLASTDRLTHLIERRLEGISPREREILEILALCEPMPLAYVRAKASDKVLQKLESDGLIRAISNGRRIQCTLGHPLYGEILRLDIKESCRMEIFAESIRYIESFGSQRSEDALRAAAWSMSATGTAKGETLIRAAMIARRAHDYRQVVALLSAVTEEETTHESRLLHGESLLEMGQWKLAEHKFFDAYSKASTDKERIAAVLAGTMALGLGIADAEKALQLNREARDAINSPTLKRTLDANEGILLVMGGRLGQEIDVMNPPEETEDDPMRFNVKIVGSVMHSVALTLGGKAEAAARLSRECYAIHSKMNYLTAAPHPASHLNAMTFALMELGRIDKARSFGLRSFDTLLKTEASRNRVWPCLLLGRVEWLAGHPISAGKWYSEGAVLARKNCHLRHLRVALAGQAAVAAQLGDLKNAQSLWSEAEQYPVLEVLAGEDILGPVWISVARGNLDTATDLLKNAARTARKRGAVATESMLLSEISRIGGAAHICPRLSLIARGCDGLLTLKRAEFCRALMSSDTRALMRLGRDFNAMGADLMASECYTQAALALDAKGHMREATRSLMAAEDSRAKCEGAQTPLLNYARRARQLSARETEIAGLVASGLKSKEVAARLYLSPRTVTNHLQLIYSKLGIQSRAQLREFMLGG
ncbi:LuxR C-terminal-related transcriptional regulator [Streptomyces sp. NPDC058701]|uniref:LuxR C-terminal-related transcriptional regulator n=1 Tax=Streptomyces sp. NPDC058701 TaxID=3346608 RepID=UPI0036595BBE